MVDYKTEKYTTLDDS